MKAELRKQLMKQRENIEELKRKELSERIFKQLTVFEPFVSSKIVMAYASFGSEVNTHDFIRTLFASKKVILPKVSGDDIIPSLVLSFDSLILGYKDILEPIEALPVKLSMIDCVLVPGLGFDKRGHRIGYGKGFYDKFLKKVPSAVKIGLCYDSQLVDSLPTEEHDVAMDYLALPDKIHKCSA